MSAPAARLRPHVATPLIGSRQQLLANVHNCTAMLPNIFTLCKRTHPLFR
jgi:hypothetical protein